jgi:hypothetical protein
VLVPEGCKLGFCKRKPHVPQMWAKWVCRKLGYKHSLPIDSPIIFDAVFAFWLRTCHFKVLNTVDGGCQLEGIVVGSCVDRAAKHSKTHTNAFATTSEAFRTLRQWRRHPHTSSFNISFSYGGISYDILLHN